MKKGFTMAEVLITLGVIGIVASMTIPMLIAKHRSKTLEALFKRRYSELSQALQMAKKDELYFYNSPNTRGQLLKVLSKYLKGKNKTVIKPNYKTFNKANTFNIRLMDDGSELINNEFYIYLNNDAYKLTNFQIVLDINGEKGPNVAGYDLFVFELTKDDTLTVPKENNDTCSPTSTDANNGYSCSYYAVTDKNYFSKLSW